MNDVSTNRSDFKIIAFIITFLHEKTLSSRKTTKVASKLETLYVLTIIKVQCNILIHHRSCGNVLTVPACTYKNICSFCQCTYTSKLFMVMFNAQILYISNTWYPFFTKNLLHHTKPVSSNALSLIMVQIT